MRVVDDGHIYDLKELEGGWQRITFIKRSSGSIQYDEEWPGLQTQEVLRALIDRTKYLYAVRPCDETADAIHFLRMALYSYELRAWLRKSCDVNRKGDDHESRRIRTWRREYVGGVPFTEFETEILVTGRDGHVLPRGENLVGRLHEGLRRRILIEADGCWRFTGKWTSGNGYSKVRHRGKVWMVHRLVYEMTLDRIPDGLVLDHLCRRRWCCNPMHMEPVTVAENTHRGEAKLFLPTPATGCRGADLTKNL